jgi:hypothetical protein
MEACCGGTDVMERSCAITWRGGKTSTKKFLFSIVHPAFYLLPPLSQQAFRAPPAPLLHRPKWPVIQRARGY